MPDDNSKQLRLLHIVSSGGVTGVVQQSLFMPLMTRLPKQRVKVQVISLAPNAVSAAVLRLNGVPVHDVALSKRRFSLRGVRELTRILRVFRPDVIHAWGHTAQIVAAMLRQRCDWEPRLVWGVSETTPLPAHAGMLDRSKLKLARRLAARADRIVYASEASASAHRRIGFPEDRNATISPGVDPMRYRTDGAARRRIREQLGLAPESFVIGMIAPFQPEYDQATLIKAAGELIKTNPNIHVLMAGHGVQKGNAPLMALVGGGALGTRVQLLGEWSDVPGLLNACDVACSSALNDSSRMTLVMAMLCSVPCVATAVGAQAEVLGQFGVAVEPGSPNAFIRGISKVMQLTPEKRAFMLKEARKHAMKNFVYVRSLQKYLQMYFEVSGREPAGAEEMSAAAAGDDAASNDASGSPRQQIAAIDTEALQTRIQPAMVRKPARSATVLAPEAKGAAAPAITQSADPDSLETGAFKAVPIQRPTQSITTQSGGATALANDDADVLHAFESSLVRRDVARSSLMSERARGVAEEHEEDLLAPELLEADAPFTPMQVAAAARTRTAIHTETTQQKVVAPAAVAARSDQSPVGSAQLELLGEAPQQLRLVGK